MPELTSAAHATQPPETVTRALPHPDARRRLSEIAGALAPAHAEATAKLDRLMDPPFLDRWEQDVQDAQDGYWAAVSEHIEEIARLTNNSTSTVASVFRPRRDVLDLGGVTPQALERLASGTGSWRR